MPAPQIRLTAPTPDAVRAWLIAQPDAPPPYPAAGATRDAPTDGRPPPGAPADWNVDHRRVHLGDGEAVYRAAQAALMTFAPLDIGWVWPVTTTPRPEPTTRGAMIVRAFGLVWVNAWRVVYVDDDVATADGGRRTVFAYGTMAAHAERGEERFMIEMLPDGSVWYDILAFSHPHHVLARLGGPVTRWLQRRFGPASVGRMREVVGGILGDCVAPPATAGPTEALDENPRLRWPLHRYGPSAMLLLAKWLVPAVAALLGVPSTAIGITATQLGAPHVVEALLALPMIAGALLVAAVHLGLAFGPPNLESPVRVVALRAVVGFTLLATMALALVYALRGWLPWAPTIPQMALWHGIGNAFGVATCGLVACWLDPATQPPVG